MVIGIACRCEGALLACKKNRIKSWEAGLMSRLIVLMLLCYGAVCNAASLQYDFSYTFDDGEQLYGNLLGTLLGDGDTIQIDSVVDIHYTAPLQNNCCIPDTSYDTLQTWDGSGEVSLSGTVMNFSSTPPYAYADYWALTGSAAIFDAYFDITCLEFCGEFIQLETFNSANWAIAAAVPIPPAVFLFGSGLGFLGWLRKRSAFQ
jgi:hypothetical protein